MTIQPRQIAIHGLVLAMMLSLLVWDIYTPLVFSNYVLYVAPVLLALASSNPRFAILVAAWCTLLIAAGGFLSPRIFDLPLSIQIGNRLFGALIIWVPVPFFLQMQRAREALRRLNDELEQRVHARTRELAEVNQALVAEVTERMQTEHSLRRSQEALQVSEERLRSLAAQLIAIQEEERRRISRELHDDVNQRLAMLAVALRNLEKRIATAPEFVRDGVRDAVEQLATLSDDVRSMAYRFHPSILDDLGLSAALQHVVDDFSSRTGIRSTFSCEDMKKPLPKDIASCLYRVTQECLGNVAKHAGASSVRVRLAGEQGEVELSIKDNGKGFDPQDNTVHGLGLLSMKERVRLVNGVVDVSSSPGRGTTVSVRVLTEAEETR